VLATPKRDAPVEIIAGVIRLARHEDLEAMQRLEREGGSLFREIGMGAVADDEPAALESLAECQREGRAWVAVNEHDEPVAYLLADVVDGNVHLEQVSVLPAWAHQRLGSALIDTAADWGRGEGLSAVTLTTFEQVPWNRPYYERLGFTVVAGKDLSAGLRHVRARELEQGLDRWPRVVMRRPIEPRSLTDEV
jgi:GNAT superfamily N-acetyltransferase